MKKQIVILGGGSGGPIFANNIAKKIKAVADITIISNREFIIYEPDYLFRVFDNKDFTPQYKSLRKATNRNVKVIIEEVVMVNPDEKIISLNNEEKLPYDYLIIATGANFNYEELPGYSETAHHFFTEEGVIKLREAIAEFKGGNVVIGAYDEQHKCPIGPIEFSFMLKEFLQKKKKVKDFSIEYITLQERIYNVEECNEVFTKRFEELGIPTHSSFKIDKIEVNNKQIISKSGKTINFDLLVIIPPNKGASFIKEKELVEEDGWVKVDKKTLRNPKYPEIFAIGDTTNLPVCKVGSVAHYQAKIVAKNLISEIKQENKFYEYDGRTQYLVQTSIKKAIMIDFTYDTPPKKLKSTRINSILKKRMRPLFYRGIIPGRI